MKRVPKSFDASVKQVPKHLMLDEEEDALGIIDEETVHSDGLSNGNDDLVVKINRLQVSSSPSPSSTVYHEEIAMLSSSQNSSDETLGESKTAESGSARSSSKKKKKKADEEQLLASIAQSNWQEEEERSLARCLDYGVRQAVLTAFYFAHDEDQRQYTVFKVEITTVTQTWVIYRRYSDFVTLATKLQGHCPPNFPPKTPFGGNFAREFLAKRQTLLSAWLERAILIPGVMALPDMRDFLVSQANVTPLLMQTESYQKKSSSSSSSRDEVMADGQQAKSSSSDGTMSSAQSTPKRDATAAAAQAETPPGLNISYSDGSPLALTRSSSHKSPYAQNMRKVSLGDFELLQVLGKGSFGKVVLAMKRTGKDANALFAMKILNKQNVVNKKQVEHTLTERSVLGKMNHPFIVKLHYAFQTEKKLHFVLDYCPGGELFYHLGRAGKFSEPQGRFYAAEMTLALGHLHSHGVVYRDLKPENILFEANGHLKLADFGLSKEGVESTQGSHSFCGTPEYLAPEILNRTGHGMAVDWWSLGALLYEMLTGLPPWFSQDRQKLFLGIRQAPLRFPPEVSVLARNILSDFLKRDPAERLGSKGVEQVKQHPFFASIDWVALYELRLPAPFVPRIASDADTGNFDAQFTRMPLHSEATSPPHVMVAASPASLAAIQQQQQQLQQQQQQAMKRAAGVPTGTAGIVHASSADDALFGGFTYQEDFASLMTPPTTPYGLCTPPPLPANNTKRASPLRPGPNMFHARPSSAGGGGSSSVRSVPPFPASSPPAAVTG